MRASSSSALFLVAILCSGDFVDLVVPIYFIVYGGKYMVSKEFLIMMHSCQPTATGHIR